MRFSRLIRTERERLGLTQEELACRTGLSIRTIREIESGRTGGARPSTIRLLATALDLDEQECRALQSSEAAAGAGAWPISEPAQLPPVLSALVGRETALRTLDGLLVADSDTGRPSTRIVTVSGAAGIGKTSLVTFWAHRVAPQFPDGQLFLNLRGFDPRDQALHPADALRHFMRALALPEEPAQLDLDELVARYRTAIAKRRMLIILDNARDADQVRPLLPGGLGNCVVVTSRSHLSGLVATVGAQPIQLDLLDADEARALLRLRVGQDRLAAEPDAVDRIAARCGGLPLAVAIVAARMATRPDATLTALAQELEEPDVGLEPFSNSDPLADIRAAFCWSYQAVTPASARLFRLLTLHPGSGIDAWTAASLAGEPVPRTRAYLAELADAQLIGIDTNDRYVMHDLLRTYAEERLHAEEDDGEQSASRRRMLDHYLHTGAAAAQQLSQRFFAPHLEPAAAGVAVRPCPDAAAARLWFTVEHRSVVPVVQLAGQYGFDVHAWQLALAWVCSLDRGAHWADLDTIQRVALAAANRLADPFATARVSREVAVASARLGDFDAAEAHLNTALSTFHSLDERTAEADVHNVFGWLHDQRGAYAEAMHHARTALALWQTVGDRRGEGDAWNGVGWLHARLGEYDEALTCCKQSLALVEQQGHRSGQAEVLDSIGYIQQLQGNHQEALESYQAALAIYDDLGDRYFAACTLVRLGDVHQETGSNGTAISVWLRAYEIFDDLNHPDADGVSAKLEQARAASQ